MRITSVQLILEELVSIEVLHLVEDHLELVVNVDFLIKNLILRFIALFFDFALRVLGQCDQRLLKILAQCLDLLERNLNPILLFLDYSSQVIPVDLSFQLLFDVFRYSWVNCIWRSLCATLLIEIRAANLVREGIDLILHLFEDLPLQCVHHVLRLIALFQVIFAHICILLLKIQSHIFTQEIVVHLLPERVDGAFFDLRDQVLVKFQKHVFELFD